MNCVRFILLLQTSDRASEGVQDPVVRLPGDDLGPAVTTWVIPQQQGVEAREIEVSIAAPRRVDTHPIRGVR